MSGLTHCSECEANYILTINWPDNSFPSFTCEPIIVNPTCQSDEYIDTDLICKKCDQGSRGKPGVETCTFSNSVFTAHSCKNTFNSDI